MSRWGGQRLARAELSKALYHPHQSLPQRLWSLGRTLLGDLYRAGAAFPGGWWAVVALTTLLALAAGVVATQLGPLARARRRAGDPAWGASLVSAAAHRRRARERAEAGDFAAAIMESVRAIGRELEERGVLAPRLGRTTAEVAAESARALPAEAAELRRAARLFDDVCYGGRAGTAGGYAAVRDLDARILAVGPTLAQAADPGPPPAGHPGPAAAARGRA